ncbi:MAG: hypothetical protein ACU0AZ_10045 [Paracoccaceae bacterium]
MTNSTRPGHHRKFIAAILAISIAVTGFSAAPARAGDDFAKALAGLTALAILGVAIDRRNDRKDRKKQQTVTRSPRQPIVITPDNPQHPRPVPDRVARYDLPSQCVRTFDGFGNRKFLGQRCLRKNYSYAAELPNKCRFNVNNGHKNRKAYGAKCLRKRGYRITHY